MTPLYTFTAYLDDGVRGRMWLNGLPLHKRMTRGPESLAGGVSHLLVTGHNTLAIEILRLARRGKVVPVSCKIFLVDKSGDEPVITPVVNFELALERGAGDPEAPFYREVSFTVPGPMPEPPYASAPLAAFPCSGTAELREAVTELHGAIATQDVARFLELVRLKHEAFTRAYPADPTATMERQRGAASAFFAKRPRIEPLDLAALHFEPRLGGRVAHVTGHEERPALVAVAEDDARLALRTDLLFTRHKGGWRVFG